MKTSRLKNIVIVILLLVNAFLLFLLLSRRAEERDSNERRVEQLCTLFEKNGVAFDRALLPDEETHLSLSLERDAYLIIHDAILVDISLFRVMTMTI